jgi:hypothetical protein
VEGIEGHEGLDDVLRRLEHDDAFRQRLTTRPQEALDGYELTTEDLDTLARHLDGSGAAPGFADLFAADEG